MGVTYLLDTHVFLWVLGEPARIPAAVRDILADRRNALLISAASAMEVATKVRLGRLDVARHLVDTWAARTADVGAADLPINTAHALLAGAMTWPHRDPFDRLLVAQALVENAVLVTTDAVIADLPGLRTLTW